jgi:ABC-type transporter Mla subunit MlaD
MSEETFRIVIAAGVGLAALSMLSQLFVMLGIASGIKKLQARVQTTIDRAEPILDTTRRVLDDAAPKISAISADVVQLAKTSREVAAQVKETLADISAKTKAQVDRVDGAIGTTITQVESARDAVKGAVLRPVREVEGIVSGIRTAVAVYAQGRRASVDHATQDEEMFI